MTQTTTAPLQKPLSRFPSTSRMGPWRTARLPALFFLLLAFFLLATIYFQWTLVSGLELNSHTWETRRFSFRRDPFTNRQLSGLRYDTPVNNALGRGLANPSGSKLAAAIKVHRSENTILPMRWDLVALDGSGKPPGDASVLVTLLQAKDPSSNPYWELWSNHHSPQADVLWPAVQHLVEFGLYAKLVPLFDEASRSDELEQFESVVSRCVRSALLEHCQRLSQSGDHAQARLAAQVAVSYGEDEQQLFDKFLHSATP